MLKSRLLWCVLLIASLALGACDVIFNLEPLPTEIPTLAPPPPSNTPPPPSPSPQAFQGALTGRVWRDVCPVGSEATALCKTTASGIFQGNGQFEDGETPLSGIAVNLGAGQCPASGLAVVRTDNAGIFRFDDVGPGTYCVSIDPTENPALASGGWTFPEIADKRGRAEQLAAASAGEVTGNVNFGWDDSLPPTPTHTPTPTITLTPTNTGTATRTGAPTRTRTLAPPTASATRTTTRTPTTTLTPTITSTPTPTPTGSATVTFTPSATSTPTPTFTPTLTNTPSVTFTPTATATPTASSTATTALVITSFTIIPPPTVNSGVAGNYTVRALDQNGTTLSSYTGTINIVCTDNVSGVVCPSSYTFTPADSGVAVIAITLVSTGPQTITVADSIATSATGLVTVTVQ